MNSDNSPGPGRVAGKIALVTGAGSGIGRATAQLLARQGAEVMCADLDIRVNCTSLSGVKTPMWQSMPFFQELMQQEGGEEEAFQAMLAAAPHGRWALPAEVAAGILYLASDESSFVNGTNLVFDNGDT